MEEKRAISVKMSGRMGSFDRSSHRRLSMSNEMKESYYGNGPLEQKIYDMRPWGKEAGPRLQALVRLKVELEEVSS
jgi:hypothetical protein